MLNTRQYNVKQVKMKIASYLNVNVLIILYYLNVNAMCF